MDKGRVEVSWIPLAPYGQYKGPKSLLEEKKWGRDAMRVNHLRETGMLCSKYSHYKTSREEKGARKGSRFFWGLMPALCAFLAAPLDQQSPFPSHRY